MSQPHDPYHRLETTTRAAPPPSEPPTGPDPKFWGEARPRRTPRRRQVVARHAVGGPFDRLRDVVAAWRGDARAGLAVLVAVAVVAGVVWYRVGSGGASASPRATPRRTGSTVSSSPSVVDEPGGAPAGSGGRATGTATTTGKRLIVHVAGAVARPGVVELAAGSRVIDALEAAGGGLPEADLDRLNLAAKLADGQRVLVQKIGDPPATDGSGVAVPGGAGATPGSEATGPVNLNTATLDQLDQLPGIGPTLAAAILAERDRRGSFRSVNELRDVRGIGEKRFADLRDLVTV